MDYKLALVDLSHSVTLDGGSLPDITLDSSNPQVILDEPRWSAYQVSADAQKAAGEITIDLFVTDYYDTGAFSTEIINMTGAPSVKGSLVRFVAGPGGQPLAGFVLADYNVQVPHDGVVLDDGVADGETCLVATGGVVEILMAPGENWAAGQYIKLSSTVSGRGSNAGSFISTTDYVVGKVLIGKDNAAQTLATSLFTRAGRASSYALFGTYSDANNFEQVKLTATPPNGDQPGTVQLGIQRVGTGRELPLEMYSKEVMQGYDASVLRHSYLLGKTTTDATPLDLPLDGYIVSFMPYTVGNMYYLRAKVQAVSLEIGFSGLFEIEAVIIPGGTIVGKTVTPLFRTSPYSSVSVDLSISDHIQLMVTGLSNGVTPGVRWGAQVDVLENVVP